MEEAVDDLIAFLKARLDEDEQAAREATDGPWTDEFSGETGHCVIPADAMSTREYVAKTQLLAALPDARHIALHDPARVLREVEAKRRIVDTYTEVDAHPNRLTYAFMQQQWVALRAVIAALALPYSDHEGYREEWKP